MRRLGVLAGSFDPVHQGHMALAREAKCSAGLDGVVLLPLARPGRETEKPETRKASPAPLRPERENPESTAVARCMQYAQDVTTGRIPMGLGRIPMSRSRAIRP